MNKKQEAEMIRKTMSLLGSRKSIAKTRAARLNAKRPRGGRKIENVGGFNWRCQISGMSIYLYQPSKPRLADFKREAKSSLKSKQQKKAT